MAAMGRCVLARGEANWTNGYRAAMALRDPAEESRLYAKEQLQWKRVGDAEKAFKRLAQRLLRAERGGTR